MQPLGAPFDPLKSREDLPGASPWPPAARPRTAVRSRNVCSTVAYEGQAGSILRTVPTLSIERSNDAIAPTPLASALATR